MSEEPPSRGDAKKNSNSPTTAKTETRARPRAIAWVKNLIRGKVSNSNEQLQEVLEDYIEELRESDLDDESVDNQKELITNVLKTRDLRVDDVMVARANIVAIDQNASLEDLRKLFTEKQFSRIPVYDGTLDQIVGSIHTKDILICLLEGRECKIKDMVREAMIVHPGLPIMDLFTMMRDDKKHMAMVVDEHGGIDGLVTLNDVIEAILGDIEDEFEHDELPSLVEKPDGSIVADARMDIEDFEEKYGNFLTGEEREEIDTLGGLAFEIAGRVPKTGETLKHASGLMLDILDADQSKIHRIRIRNIPAQDAGDEV